MTTYKVLEVKEIPHHEYPTLTETRIVVEETKTRFLRKPLVRVRMFVGDSTVWYEYHDDENGGSIGYWKRAYLMERYLADAQRTDQLNKSREQKRRETIKRADAVYASQRKKLRPSQTGLKTADGRPKRQSTTRPEPEHSRRMEEIGYTTYHSDYGVGGHSSSSCHDSGSSGGYDGGGSDGGCGGGD